MKVNQQNKKEIVKLFAQMNSKSDFLELLNFSKSLIYGEKTVLFTEKQLNFYINIEQVRKGKDVPTYTSFTIKKKSGKLRAIHAPIKGLEEFQKSLNIILSAVYTPHKSAYGFVQGKSIVDNARNHVKKNYVYNIDLKDFFPSVDAKRVWGRLQVKPFNLGSSIERKQVANMIKAICCTTMNVERFIHNEWTTIESSVLPQGAATSPILTNAICEKLDIRLTGLSKRFGIDYTRYADDITFSSMHNVYVNADGNKEPIYKKGSSFDKELRRIIASQNFNINEKKVRLQKRGYKQEVTGLLVNEKVNTPRFYIKELRQWIHVWETKGYDQAYVFFLKKYLRNKGELKNGKPNMRLVIEGKLLYLKMVKGEDNKTYQKLKKRFENLSTKQITSIKNKESKSSSLSVVMEDQFNYQNDIKSNNKDINTIIETIFKDGLDKAMELYQPK